MSADPLPAYDVRELAQAEAGAARLSWAAGVMPALARVTERFAGERPFDGIRVAACMHVTPETGVFLRALTAGGAAVSLAASNPLSTQDDVAAALVQHDGVAVFARHGVDRGGYRAHLDRALDAGPHLVLDDACDLVNALHGRRPHLADDVLGACEETTTGVLRLREMSRAGVLRFPVLAVNDTPTKRLLDNRYGTGQSTLDAVLRATNVLLAGRCLVVAGYGPCGKGIAERARGLGARVVVTEVAPARALEAALDGFAVLPMQDAAPAADVIVTATGTCGVVRGEHLAALRDGVVLANAGHFDVEIDVAALREAAARVTRVRPHTDAYLLPGGRRVLLVAEGRVANLAAAEGHPPSVMDVAFTVQALTAAWLVAHHGELAAGVHGVPEAIDTEAARLALEPLDARLDVLTAEQQRYLTSWDAGT